MNTHVSLHVTFCGNPLPTHSLALTPECPRTAQARARQRRCSTMQAYASCIRPVLIRPSMILILPLFACFMTAVSAQVIPDIPQISSSATPIPSPTPTHSPIPSASPVTAPLPTGPGAGGSGDGSGSPVGSPSPSKPPFESPEYGEEGVDACCGEDPDDHGGESQQNCARDVSNPKPTLGISTSRFAFSVFASAAAIGLSTLLYKTASDWRTDQGHRFLRIIAVVLARLLIIFSIKLSSALIAVTQNATTEDRGADVGGAYLTWATAVLSSVFHESLLMTCTATGFLEKSDTWYPQLCHYLSPLKANVTGTYQQSNDISHVEAQRTPDNESEVQLHPTAHSISLWQLVTSGRIDRHLLILAAVLYVLMAVTTIITSLLQLLQSLSTNSNRNVFVPGDEAGQCPIMGTDILGTEMFLQ